MSSYPLLHTLLSSSEWIITVSDRSIGREGSTDPDILQVKRASSIGNQGLVDSSAHTTQIWKTLMSTRESRPTMWAFLLFSFFLNVKFSLPRLLPLLHALLLASSCVCCWCWCLVRFHIKSYKTWGSKSYFWDKFTVFKYSYMLYSMLYSLHHMNLYLCLKFPWCTTGVHLGLRTFNSGVLSQNSGFALQSWLKQGLKYWNNDKNKFKSHS